jgi:hypothetical protein
LSVSLREACFIANFHRVGWRTFSSMNWINIQTATLRSPQFIGSDPTARGTWLAVLGYCYEQENGGKICGCKDWKDRQWQQICGVTRDEIDGSGLLMQWEGNDLCVSNYPRETEHEIKAKRAAGRKGGKARSQAKIEAARANGAKHNPSTTQAQPKQPPNEIEKKGKEIEKKTEASVPAASSTRQADLLGFPPQPASPPKPKSEHDAIKDALAGCGGADPSQVVPSAWSGIGKALADIMAVCPQVTPDEIARRSANYRTHMSADTILTPHALAKNWALCDNPNPRNKPAQETEFGDAFEPDFQPHFHRNNPTTTQ